MQYLLAALLIIWLIYHLKQQGKVLPSKGVGDMTKEEARLVLGVSEGATPEEVQKAYQTLLKKLHPDTGGSDYLTQQIIKAKKVLDDE